MKFALIIIEYVVLMAFLPFGLKKMPNLPNTRAEENGKTKIKFTISLARFIKDDIMRKLFSFAGIIFIVFIFLVSTANAILLTSNILNDPSVIDFSQFAGTELGPFESPVQVGNTVGIDVTVSGAPAFEDDGAYLINRTWGLWDNGQWNDGRNGFAGYDARDFRSGTLMFSFNDNPVSAVGAFINDAPEDNVPQGGAFIISAYNVDLVLLESYDLWSLAPIDTSGMKNAGAFRGIALETSLISHFGITGYLPVADDLAFTTTPVPEPATMILLGTGLLGLVSIGRKKFLKQ